MRLRVIGCSPAWPNPGGAHSGYLVEEGGRRLLLDCGPGVLARLREREPWPRVDGIVITHLHLDHWGDLFPWAYGVLYGAGREVPIPELWLPPGGAEAQRALDLMLGTSSVLEVFAVREYREREPFTVAGIRVTAVPTLHYGETSFGLRVTGDRATIGYTADSGPTDSLLELARDVDLLLCEATLAEPEPGPRGHLTAEEAIEVHRASGARRLLVVHRPVELPLPDGVERARDGLEVEV